MLHLFDAHLKRDLPHSNLCWYVSFWSANTCSHMLTLVLLPGNLAISPCWDQGSVATNSLPAAASGAHWWGECGGSLNGRAEKTSPYIHCRFESQLLRKFMEAWMTSRKHQENHKIILQKKQGDHPTHARVTLRFFYIATPWYNSSKKIIKPDTNQKWNCHIFLVDQVEGFPPQHMQNPHGSLESVDLIQRVWRFLVAVCYVEYAGSLSFKFSADCQFGFLRLNVFANRPISWKISKSLEIMAEGSLEVKLPTI